MHENVTITYSGAFTCCRLLEPLERQEMAHDQVEAVREFTYLDDKESSSGGCEADGTVGTRFGLVKLRECDVES